MSPHAKPPFRVLENALKFVVDADGALVLSCSADTNCTARYSDHFISDNPHFMCPECGCIGLRMEEATPAQCGLETKP